MGERSSILIQPLQATTAPTRIPAGVGLFVGALVSRGLWGALLRLL
jgi:hypothetical protein